MDIITKEDLIWFSTIGISFSIMAYVVIPFLNNVPNQYYFAAYSAFVVIYALFVWYFVFKKKTISPAGLLGIAFLFLAGDIIMPPLLVTPQGPLQNIPGEAQFSSDIFIYRLLPDFLGPQIKYFMTYVGVPAILIMAAGHLLSYKVVKENIL